MFQETNSIYYYYLRLPREAWHQCRCHHQWIMIPVASPYPKLQPFALEDHRLR